MSRANRCLAVAALAGIVVAGCGGDDDDESGATVDSTAAPHASVDEWCAKANETLPALASPNPDGRELEVLDQHLARATSLAAGAPDVPEEAVVAAEDFAAAVADIRARVADGEELPAVLTEIFADEDSVLIVTGTALDEQLAVICG